jgi:hypothetical protein
VSRLVPLPGDYARLWEVVAKHRKQAGDHEGAKMARWQAASIRSELPLNKRPEDMRL